ncbi:MAG: type II secretion system protein M [Gammaproteobacteria bacterium]|jgi:general secretion pathway protein M|nr:type II secretion system protein M [Gammaproteobacteria bacterium]MBT5204992.1 type II secretion system protein M [Gammaproteobacteria bacterium]MBT5602236.1 type II secretion system protein M [Gammaproteobacteria bacterium]MBT6244226.1 type II secretion system protein M [Gammaproteobacteria bacterium]
MKARWLSPWWEKYAALPRRDRGMLAVLTVFLVVVLGYLLVWTPVDEYRQRGMEDRDRHLELLEMMRRTEIQARQKSVSKGSAVTGRNLLSIISREAQQLNIKANRLQPEGQDAVSLWFDNIPFDDLLMLLEKVQSEYGVSVEQIVVDRGESGGAVRTRLILKI